MKNVVSLIEILQSYLRCLQSLNTGKMHKRRKEKDPNQKTSTNKPTTPSPSKQQNNKPKSPKTPTSSCSEGMRSLRDIAFSVKSGQCSQTVELELTMLLPWAVLKQSQGEPCEEKTSILHWLQVAVLLNSTLVVNGEFPVNLSLFHWARLHFQIYAIFIAVFQCKMKHVLLLCANKQSLFPFLLQRDLSFFFAWTQRHLLAHNRKFNLWIKLCSLTL